MNIPKELLIATGNEGKFVEIKELLRQIEVKAISPFQFNIAEPEETGKTFAENSLLKAKFYSQKTNLFSLADDSGLCIEDLNDRPGIHSARFAIDEKTGKKNFSLAFEKIFSELKQIGIDVNQKPKAHFICNLSLFDTQSGFALSFEGRVDGHLVLPRGNKGFGYDPIFVKSGMNQTFGEIDSVSKDKISHRAAAFFNLIEWFKNQQNILV